MKKIYMKCLFYFRHYKQIFMRKYFNDSLQTREQVLKKLETIHAEYENTLYAFALINQRESATKPYHLDYAKQIEKFSTSAEYQLSSLIETVKLAEEDVLHAEWRAKLKKRIDDDVQEEVSRISN